MSSSQVNKKGDKRSCFLISNVPGKEAGTGVYNHGKKTQKGREERAETT